ncbi:Flagellar protein export ATPase FliI [Candidatus Bealeia paramacronuclearis]|uniref:Flagellum-specific ATP synthase n=1 Tax=Candidatus Bealeia paramacronuclearis TaxID=1921001 RepID=A0ABZ2C408_9PROT|nr:Flagellar protein export ATPase FliI [Candidatus Bealeia paramacronuclearis]
MPLNTLKNTISEIPSLRWSGRVRTLIGLIIEVEGLEDRACTGSRVEVRLKSGKSIWGEVIGFRGDITLVMPYESLEGIGPGDSVIVCGENQTICPTEKWLGRVINGLGEPLDGGAPLPQGSLPYPIKTMAPPAHARKRVGSRIDLGIRALNTFTTMCRGQRMGIFAGSGVGKSVLLSQLARFTACDVAVIGLIGERGREVQEFIQDQLGPEGLKRSVVVVATSDESALLRKQAAYMTLTIAEYFRDQGLTVLCLMDSITRFAMAQREIGLSLGEPPTTKGYPPTVFAELPRLLERAGPGTEKGTITGIFTILVDGDDHNEPIADAARSILDGHIVLERQIAERGRYPAINILKSISRMMPDCNAEDESVIIKKARESLSIYEDMEDMIRLGAYKRGSDPQVDLAIALHDQLYAFLSQGKNEHTTFTFGFLELAQILNMPIPESCRNEEETQLS